MSEPKQLSLAVYLRDDATLDNFVAGRNAPIVALASMLGAAGESRLYVWGAAGSGRTHLLQATCHAQSGRGLSCAYIPLQEREDLAPVMLEDMEHNALVCLDDVDLIAGDAEWEQALFNFYNRAAATGCALLLSASAPPNAVVWNLADWRSRLTAAVIYRLESLNDDEKTVALQQRAQRRGMELNDETARFLLRHVRRDTGNLFALLDRLDEASLAAQRRLTVPFVKQVLGS